jgi:hypothetical protein
VEMLVRGLGYGTTASSTSGWMNDFVNHQRTEAAEETDEEGRYCATLLAGLPP